ncbi:MAG: HD-GYP domain-containing protein, partial [Sphingomonas sp.]
VSESAKWLTRAKPGSHAQECLRARAIMTEARAVVRDIHHKVGEGQRVDPRRLDPVVEAIIASIERDPTAIPSVTQLRLRHDYTYHHSVAVCGLMVGMGRALRLGDAELYQIGIAGLLHDIGKARVPEPLINKPAALDDHELHLVRQHPAHGHDVLQAANCLSAPALDVVLNHHERMDGSGYPAGKRGADLSRHARMSAICDVYDAVTSARSYRSAWSPGEALEWMRSAYGQFDAALLKSFAKTLGPYPCGSLVRIKGERLAIVLDPGNGDPLDPPIMVYMDAGSRRRLPAIRKERAGDSIIAVEYAERLGLADWAVFRQEVLRPSLA